MTGVLVSGKDKAIEFFVVGGFVDGEKGVGERFEGGLILAGDEGGLGGESVSVGGHYGEGARRATNGVARMNPD